MIGADVNFPSVKGKEEKDRQLLPGFDQRGKVYSIHLGQCTLTTGVKKQEIPS